MCPSSPQRWSGPSGRRSWWVILAVLLIGALTLHAHPDSDLPPHTWGFCLFCGDLGGIDFLLNIALFLPLGMAWRWAGGSRSSVMLVSFIYTLMIEGLQFGFLPGRFASLGDIVSNTLGGPLGWMLLDRWQNVFFPTAISARRFTTLWFGIVVLILGLTGWLLQPSLPNTVWYGQWRPALGAYDQFMGTVDSAALGDRPLPGHRLTDTPERIRALDGKPIRLVAFGTTGNSTHRVAPIVSIYDHREEQIALLGQRRADLVISFRTVGTDLGFRHPRLRIPDALGSDSGRPYEVTGTRLPGALMGRVVVGQDERTTTIRLTLAAGWLQLFPLVQPDHRWYGAGNALWLLSLALILGYFCGRGWGRSGGAIALGFLFGFVVITQGITSAWSVATLAPSTWVSLVLGLALGWRLGIHTLKRGPTEIR